MSQVEHARKPRRLTGLIGLLCATLIVSGCTVARAISDDEVIEQDPTTRTVGTRIDDNALTRLALINIRRASDDLMQANLSVSSHNGNVLLYGQVPSEDARALAEAEVLKLKKVRRVYNELEVAGPTSMLTRSGDAWITGKVKTQLLASEHVRGRNIKVVTENGTTYLMGLVTRLEAEEATEITRNISGVQQVVRLFEYVD
ncbi:MAG: BON domain-containing protein [Gammaproteobacteria bacterium]|nr:MAG: BON domain-containing protein [Gammaproteobacteria bacterium]